MVLMCFRPEACMAAALMAAVMTLNAHAGETQPESSEVQRQGAASSADETELRVYGAQQLDVEWRGQRAVRMSRNLCIASSTGSFRLIIRNIGASGPDLGAGGLQYIARLKAPNGAFETARLPSNGQASFAGRVDPSEECRARSNAELQLILTADEALRGVAGDYQSTIEMSLVAQ